MATCGPLTWGHAWGPVAPLRAAAARGPHKTLKRASWSLRREVLTSAAQRVKRKVGSRSSWGVGRTTTPVGSKVDRSPSRTAAASSGCQPLACVHRRQGCNHVVAALSKWARCKESTTACCWDRLIPSANPKPTKGRRLNWARWARSQGYPAPATDQDQDWAQRPNSAISCPAAASAGTPAPRALTCKGSPASTPPTRVGTISDAASRL